MLQLEEKHLKTRQETFLAEAAEHRLMKQESQKRVMGSIFIWSGRQIAHFGQWLEAIGNPFLEARQE